MRSLCMRGSVQQSNTCSHVSGCVILHSEQLVLGYRSLQKRFFLAFPIYWPYLNFKSWVICASVIVGLVQKLLDIWLSMRGLLIHLLILLNVFAISSFSSFSNCFK